MEEKPLDAGVELDLLVARRVYGERPAGRERRGRPVLFAPGSPTCPPFSSDIAAAWALVGDMIAAGWEPSVSFNGWMPDDRDHQWYCAVEERYEAQYEGDIYATEVSRWRAFEYGDSAALAISRAAVRAFGPLPLGSE